MQIPKHAKKVFQGVIFDVYQWEQKMFDGSFTTFESIKRPNTVLVIPTQDGKILISEEEQPEKQKYLTLLGGRQEPNEEPLECAQRELLEESGFVSQNWELYKVLESDGKFDWHIYLYLARNCQKVAKQKLDSGEKIEVKSITFDELINLLCQGNSVVTVEFLKLLQNPIELQQFKNQLFK